MHALSHVVLCFIISTTTLCAQNILDTYYKDRENLIEDELGHAVGGGLTLDSKEVIANDLLMHWKYKELDEAFKDPQLFNLSTDYFSYRNEIEKSKVYQIIKEMPKGAVLHVHSSMMMDPEYLLNLTYEDHLYACFDDGDLKFLFSEDVPQRPCPPKWVLLSKLRNATEDVENLDMEIRSHFTLQVKDEVDINTVWNQFNKVYSAIKSLIMFKPVREKYFYDALQKFYNDNILYVEIRTGLHELYDLGGVTYNRMYLARLYHNITKTFMEKHPDFMGVKLILTNQRKTNIENVRKALDLALQLQEELPDFFAGFDLVGQEDLGKPLVDFLPAFAAVKDKINFYFHGGETNWNGMSTDENLVDAILLGTKRIGHGYALMKHPILLDAVRSRGIAIEVNVISNEVLSLVQDVRNHPLSLYLALGLPVVLSSDDPGVWGADPLSHDFFVAFMGIASRRADLRTLKQLAINSITYSALDDERKTIAFQVFYKKWDIFINNLISKKV